MEDIAGARGGADELEVRPAREDDRMPVLEFCAQTWEEGDYIADVWDDWLRDTAGALLVGTVAGRPVAIVHARMMSADEAWLEGIRVDPAARRQGIGRVMVSRALVAARERGAAVARLFVDDANTVSQRLTARFGFTRVAEVALYVGEALPDARGEAAGEEPRAGGTMTGAGDGVGMSAGTWGGAGGRADAGPRLSTPGAESFEEIWAWLEQSNLSPFNGGLELQGWAARALTEPLLRAYMAAGEVWLLEEHGAILALAIAQGIPPEGSERGRLQVRYLDGLAEGIGRLALALRDLAGERDLDEVELWLPDLLILRDAMNGAGYHREMEGAMWVYARGL